MGDHADIDHTGLTGISSGAVATDVIWDAAGDQAVGTGANTAAKIPIGTAGQHWIVNAGATAPAWVTLASSKVTRINIGADLTITSATWDYVDTTNLAITMTTGARRVLLMLTGNVASSSGAISFAYNFAVDGTAVIAEAAASRGLVASTVSQAVGLEAVSVMFLTDVLSAGSHTFKPRWCNRTNANTLTMKQSSSTEAIVFSAVEMP